MNVFSVLRAGTGPKRGDEGLWRIGAPEVFVFLECSKAEVTSE
jgi:hypothetical protein